jgi:hypothetical protein
VRLLEVLLEVDLRVMSLVMLLQVLLRQEEFGAVLALNHVLLLLRRESEEVFISTESLLLDLELLLHGFQLLHLGFHLVFQFFGLSMPLAALGIQYLVHALKIVLSVQKVLNGELR